MIVPPPPKVSIFDENLVHARLHLQKPNQVLVNLILNTFWVHSFPPVELQNLFQEIL